MCGGKKGEGLSWFSCPQDLEQSFSVVFTCQGQFGIIWRIFWSSPLGGEGGHPGIWWVGTRDAAEGTGWPHTAKSDLAPNTHSEKPGSRCSGNSKRLTGPWILEKEGRFYETVAHRTPLSQRHLKTYIPSLLQVNEKKKKNWSRIFCSVFVIIDLSTKLSTS